jgi:nicotinic acid mononucleotide adenylyltransferase
MPLEEPRCDASTAMPGFNRMSLSGKATAIIKRIARNALRDLRSMKEILGESASESDFACLTQSVISSLSRVGHHIGEGRSMPWLKVNHSPDSSQVQPVPRELRLGVFPVAGNPFHWAHLLGGLFAMETFALDKIIYVIAGSDLRKPDLAPAEARHAMARSLLRLFHPLFEYSSIALRDSSSGEENLFRILEMNPLQSIHAYYIAGSDHYHRYRPMTGNPDTLMKLEQGITHAADGSENPHHRVSAVFLERAPIGEKIPTSLDVQWVPGLPVQTSSTNIRRAFSDRGQRKKLSTLPFTAYTSICSNRLYSTSSCEEPFPQTPLWSAERRRQDSAQHPSVSEGRGMTVSITSR